MVCSSAPHYLLIDVLLGAGDSRTQICDITAASSAVLPPSDTIHPPSSGNAVLPRPSPPEPDSIGSEEIDLVTSCTGLNREQAGDHSTEGGAPMALDRSFMTVTSDGFNSMKSEHSVEEILYQRTAEPSPEKRSEHAEADPSIGLDALALEPVATSSPPRKKYQVHTPRASSVPSLPPVTPTSKRESKEKSFLALPALEPVTEGSPQDLVVGSGPSPSKSSPSRSPLSRLRKDRPPLPKFDPDQDQPELNHSGDQGSARRILASRPTQSSTSPSPTPGARTQQKAMPSYLGHGRSPSSRTTGSEVGSIDRLKRAATISNESPVRASFDEIPTGRNAFDQGERYGMRPSYERPSFDRTSFDVNLGPRTARAFAAAGVMDNPGTGPPISASGWRSSSAMGLRRDGLERDFGYSGARSLASSPISMLAGPVTSTASSRRLAALQELDVRSEGGGRGRSTSESWSRLGYSRTPEMILRGLNGYRTLTDPSTTSSPTSTIPSRTAMSSASSQLPNFEPRKNLSTVDASANVHEAAIRKLKDRHELEKEAIVSALSDAKKEVKSQKAEKEQAQGELREMGIYAEELETKLGEALAKIRWLEKEIAALRALRRVSMT